MDCRRPYAILLFPPLVCSGFRNYYASLAVLAGALNSVKVRTIQRDLNHELIDWLPHSPFLIQEYSRQKRRITQIEKKESLSPREYQDYLLQLNLFAMTHWVLHHSAYDGLSQGQVYRCISSLLPDAHASITFQDLRDKLICTDPQTLSLLRRFFSAMQPLSSSSHEPLFVGISVAMATQLRPALLLARYIKKHILPSTPLFLGGAVVSLLPVPELEQILEQKLVSGIIQHEGEESVIRLQEQLRLDKPDLTQVPGLYHLVRGVPRKNQLPLTIHLDQLSPPLYDQKIVTRSRVESLSVIVGRKCYWGGCAYCDYQCLYRSRQQRSVSRVISDIESIIRNHGIQTIFLNCDCLQPEYSLRFCHAVIRKKLRVKWSCFVRVDNGYSLSVLKLMRRAGCDQLIIGLESLDDSVLARVNKGYTAAEAHSMLRRIVRSGIPYTVNVITDLPGTSFASAKRQYRSIASILEASTPGLASLSIFTFVLTSTSRMGRNPRRFDIIADDRVIRDGSGRINLLSWKDPQGMTDKQKQIINEKYMALKYKLQLHQARPMSATERQKGLLRLFRLVREEQGHILLNPERQEKITLRFQEQSNGHVLHLLEGRPAIWSADSLEIVTTNNPAVERIMRVLPAPMKTLTAMFDSSQRSLLVELLANMEAEGWISVESR